MSVIQPNACRTNRVQFYNKMLCDVLSVQMMTKIHHFPPSHTPLPFEIRYHISPTQDSVHSPPHLAAGSGIAWPHSSRAAQIAG